jgi:hypothetical protein
MPSKTKPSVRALKQQQSGAQDKRARVDTVPTSAERALARIAQAPDPKVAPIPDPNAVIAGGSTEAASSPKRISPRLHGSPAANSQVPAIKKPKTGFSESNADFAAVDLVVGNDMTLAEDETAASTIALSTKDNEVLEESAVRRTRSQNPKYLEESDDELPTNSPKGKEVQQSSSVDTTRGEKVGLDMDDSDVEDMGAEEQTGEEEPSDEEFISPVKQQPAIAKLSRGRQHKPFSPAGSPHPNHLPNNPFD